MAEQVGLSPAPCWQRLKRLETDGFITGYTAILDQQRLGAGETVIMEVRLDSHDEDTLEAFGSALTAMPEVLEIYLTAGEYDYFVKVAVSGTQGYEEFLRKRLYKIKGVRQTRSSFTLRCLKKTYSISPLTTQSPELD